MNTSKRNWKSPLILLLTAAIWGVAFVAQSVGMDYVKPFTFNGVRSLLGAVVLLPVIYIMNRIKKVGSCGAEEKHMTGMADAAETKRKSAGDWKSLWIGGISCGLCLCVASSLQQIGIQYTTAGKAGFLTAMYIVIVPILGLFLGKKCSPFVGLSIVLATIGLYLLSIKEGFTIGTGDIYVILCAVVFSLHILVIDYFAPKCDGVKLSCIQFFVCGIISSIIAFVFEKPEVSQIFSAWLPIAYAGIMSCGVAYTLQIIGQKGMNPTVASLLLSLESVISVLAGWVLLQQALSVRELIGCVIMFAAIILAQLPEKAEKIVTSQ